MKRLLLVLLLLFGLYGSAFGAFGVDGVASPEAVDTVSSPATVDGVTGAAADWSHVTLWLSAEGGWDGSDYTVDDGGTDYTTDKDVITFAADGNAAIAATASDDGDGFDTPSPGQQERFTETGTFNLLYDLDQGLFWAKIRVNSYEDSAGLFQYRLDANNHLGCRLDTQGGFRNFDCWNTGNSSANTQGTDDGTGFALGTWYLIIFEIDVTGVTLELFVYKLSDKSLFDSDVSASGVTAQTGPLDEIYIGTYWASGNSNADINIAAMGVSDTIGATVRAQILNQLYDGSIGSDDYPG